MTAAVRPTVSVFSASEVDKVVSTTPLPEVMTCPIRPDLIQMVHNHLSMNNRQAYAVKEGAGMDTAAESWGTGRAVSRIPRVPGGGTHRAGQGAFGNMCRGGRMFAPTKIWRKWHMKTPLRTRRYAVASALAASAVPALVMARGHRVDQVPELPLVLSTEEVKDFKKTKQGVACLKTLGLEEELEKVAKSKRIRPGRGKIRNRRFLRKKGLLLVTSEDEGSSYEKAFKGIVGVEVAKVEKLNLLDLAPGGKVGRLIVWSEAAFNKLNTVFGTRAEPSKLKKGFVLPRGLLENADIQRILNSDEIQKELRPIRGQDVTYSRKGLGGQKLENELNPFREEYRKRNREASKPENVEAAKKTKRAEKDKESSKESRKNFFEQMIS